jgi:hypothetical protein
MALSLMKVPPAVITLLCVWSVMTLNTTADVTMSYRVVLAPDGTTLCAADKPSYTVSVNEIQGIPSGVPDTVRCGYHCTGRNCTGFNYRPNDVTQCHMYNFTTTHCAVEPGCYHYEV